MVCFSVILTVILQSEDLKCRIRQPTMTKIFQSTVLLTLILFTTGLTTRGQNKAITYINYKNAYDNKTNPEDTVLLGFRVFEPKINEITLNPDATFDFWSRPHVSCFTWQSYKGTWEKINDTLLFRDHYQVDENNIKESYKSDSRKEFILNFKTDKGSSLKNKNITIEFDYDFDSQIDSQEKSFTIDANNSVIILFKDVPNLDKIAALRIEYLLNFTEKRYTYLTENKTVNIKENDLPNIINVEFIERPKKEIVYRTITALVKKDKLKIISISKTKTTLPDYKSEIQFEESYSLKKK